ncbi:MAG: hypothetical protein ACR2II_01400, partial [Chthoniobacterales bacterium]
MKFATLFRARSVLPLLFTVSLAGTAVSARGQGSGADRARLQTSQAQIPTSGTDTANGVDQNYAAASPNDPDLGEQAILKRVEAYQPFTIETG